MSRESGRTQGYLLIEALIATAIIAGMMALTFQSIAATATASRLVSERREAVMVAQSALATAESEGRFNGSALSGRSGPYRWQVNISPFRVDTRGEAPPLRLLTASVDDTRINRRVMTLQTLRVAL